MKNNNLEIEFDVVNYLKIIKKYFWIVFIVGIIFSVGGYFVLQKVTPMYAYTTLFKAPKVNVDLASANPFQMPSFLAASTGTAQEVVDFLRHKYINVEREMLDTKPFIKDVLITESTKYLELTTQAKSHELAKTYAQGIVDELHGHYAKVIQQVSENIHKGVSTIEDSIKELNHSISDIEKTIRKVGRVPTLVAEMVSSKEKKTELESLKLRFLEKLSGYNLHNVSILSTRVIKEKASFPPFRLVLVGIFIFTYFIFFSLVLFKQVWKSF